MGEKGQLFNGRFPYQLPTRDGLVPVYCALWPLTKPSTEEENTFEIWSYCIELHVNMFICQDTILLSKKNNVHFFGK